MAAMLLGLLAYLWFAYGQPELPVRGHDQGVGSIAEQAHAETEGIAEHQVAVERGANRAQPRLALGDDERLRQIAYVDGAHAAQW